MIACFAPVETQIFSAEYSIPLSFFNFWQIAFLRSGIPGTAVYLVKPLSIASLAASRIFWGVPKSGSPIFIFTMSMPFWSIWATLAFNSTVTDGWILFALLLSFIKYPLCYFLLKNLILLYTYFVVLYSIYYHVVVLTSTFFDVFVVFSSPSPAQKIKI